MRKFIWIYFVYLTIITALQFVPIRAAQNGMTKVEVYFADRQMMRLVPVDYYINDTTPRKECSKIIEVLSRDRGYDSNIRQIIPDISSVSVRVKGAVAVVNIKSEKFENYEKVRAMENLIVFQIVNSLVTVEEISRVEFLIDGKKQKDFFGFIDMREAFVPDYYV